MVHSKARKGGERIEREQKTVAAMITLYCRRVHGSRDAICPECFELLEYARFRLSRCPYGAEKSTCNACLTH